MGEDESKKPEKKEKTINRIMRARSRIDRIIKEKYRKKMSILFSDVCGFTAYTEARGDVNSRAWIQQHNDIVLPLIESHDGKILKIMGDGVLSAFSSTISAVKASIAIQKNLAEYNKSTDLEDEIHVSMGINTGDILTDEEDIAGDVVNVASRIESKADRDQILISKSTYEDVLGSDDILCRLYGYVSVKGKAKPLELYQVVWQDEDIILSSEPRVRSDEKIVTRKPISPLKILQLEITREEDSLKISVSEQNAGEVNTIRNYEEISAPMKKIGERCQEIIETLNKANRKGYLTRQVLMKLRETGQVFRDELLTINIKKIIENFDGEHLILNLDEQLVHIPWELLHDGRQFLCQRFNMGRLIKTRQTLASNKTRHLARPLKMLVLANPSGDLKGAYNEGRQIRDFMDKEKSIITASLGSEGITHDYIMQKIRNFDLVHFAGHAEYHANDSGEGGWRLSDGILRAEDIYKITGTTIMPALIFSNACQSARTEERRLNDHSQNDIFGLANAFMVAGVRHYVGTFWEILDEPSRLFALEFYKRLIVGMTTGEAMRMARLELIEKLGEETIVWASYLLYGDPTFNYMDQIHVINDKIKEPQVYRTPAAEARGITLEKVQEKEEKRTFDKEERKKSVKMSKVYWGLAGAVILACLIWISSESLTKGGKEYERAVIASYQAGDYSKARKACEVLLEKRPGNGLAYLVLGNILFSQGSLDEAESSFKNALEYSKGTDDQKVEALMGLGRISSIRKDTAGALDYYQQASKIAPGAGQAYISQGILLDQQGEYDQALALFQKAEELAPDNYTLRAMANEIRNKASAIADKERQEKIDRLVKELLSSTERTVPTAQSDGWTSLPLTIWMMDFKSTGYTLEEGKENLIASGIIGRIIEKSRGQVVERAILDKLMEELKLSTTKLVDRTTALSLGRIMAARLILSGQVVYAGPETQFSIRMIETETGAVKGAVNEVFGSAVPISIISDRLSTLIVEKLGTIYPLRGKVTEVNEDDVILNIGQKEGVQQGQQFLVKEKGSNMVLEITGVDQVSSTARMERGSEAIHTGMRVEIL